MMTPSIFRSRRRYFINWPLQGQMVIGVVAASLLSFLMILVDYYLSFGRNAGWDPAMLEIFLKSQKLPVLQLVIFIFVLVFVTIFLSHRVAGPLVNLENSLDRAAEGDLTARIQLRPRDQLKNIRDAFNRMMISLQTRVAADRKRLVDARQPMERLLETPGLSSEVRAELKKVQSLLNDISNDFTI